MGTNRYQGDEAPSAGVHGARRNIRQFIQFGLVGISNTLISEVIYVIIVFLRGNYVFASVMGFVISVLNAFYWNNKFVFKESETCEKRIWWKALIKTYVAYLGGYLCNLFLLVMFVDVLCIAGYMGPVVQQLAHWNITCLDADVLGNLVAEGLSLIITIPINFLLNKYWAFRQKHPGASIQK